MIYLIYTAILFEIIFAIALVYVIVKFDVEINGINIRLLENRYNIREFARLFRNKIGKIYTYVGNIDEKIKKKRNSLLLNILKKLVITSSLQIFLKKYKKQLIYAELILIAYKTVQNCLKA